MKGITRDDLLKVWKWKPEDVEGCDFVILRKDGTVYDVYKDKRTAFRVLGDLISRYGEDQFEVAEVVAPALDAMEVTDEVHCSAH